jgi:hypothetical protein
MLNACTNDTFNDSNKHFGCSLGALTSVQVEDDACSADPLCKYAVVTRHPYSFKRFRKESFRAAGDVQKNAQVWTNWHRAWIDVWRNDTDKVGFFKYEDLVNPHAYPALAECFDDFIDRGVAQAYTNADYMAQIDPTEAKLMQQTLDSDVMAILGYSLDDDVGGQYA